MLRGRLALLCICAACGIGGQMEAAVIEKDIQTNENAVYSVSEDWPGDEDEENFEELDAIWRDRTDVGFSDVYDCIKSGDIGGAFDNALKALADSLVYELREGRTLAVQILAVIVLGSLFARTADGTGLYVSENGFLVTYMILMSFLLGEFLMVQTVAADAIDSVTAFMEAFYPMYASTIVYVNGPETAKYSQVVIVLVIYVCQNVIAGVILPIIKCHGIMSLVNNLGREDYFSKLSNLMRDVASWGMKSMFAVITGINVIKTMIAPSMDRVSRAGILQSLGRVSGMASVSAVCSVIISTGEFIKSCMGAACTVVLIVLSVVPMMKILVIVFTLKCIAAIVQPIGDKRFANGVSAVSDASALVLRACGISVMMFVLSVALMTISIGG